MRILNMPLRSGATLLCLALLSGCGGGGSSPSVTATDRNSGGVELKLTFPASRAAVAPKRGTAKTRAFGGNIPLGTKVVHLVITNTTTGAVLASRDVTGPTGGNNANGTLPNLVTVDFPVLPVGPVTVAATAFPDLASALNAIATGSATATIQPLLTTDVTVTMSLALTALTMDQTMASISTPGAFPNTVVLNALPVNAAGGALVLPLYWTNSDPAIVTLTVNPANPAQVTITGVAGGTSTITVYEPNSDRTATCAITVFAS